jgi:hypothetical protein
VASTILGLIVGFTKLTRIRVCTLIFLTFGLFNCCLVTNIVSLRRETVFITKQQLNDLVSHFASLSEELNQIG